MEVSRTKRNVQGPFWGLFCGLYYSIYLIDIQNLLRMQAFYAWGIPPFGVEKRRLGPPVGGEPGPTQRGNGA